LSAGAILCIDRPLPGATFEKYQPHLQAEVRHTWDSYESGVVRDIYLRQDRPGVAVFLECSSVDEAKAVLAELPLVKAGLIDFELIPLGAFTNWEILFATAAN
jgi:hypothetical protein